MTDEPTPVGQAIPPSLLARLEKMGVRPAVEFIPTREKSQEDPEDRAERDRRRQSAYLARWTAQVPPMYATAAPEDLDVKIEWPSESLHLVLAGPVGTGKTHAAYAIGNRLAQTTWVTAVTVVDALAAHRPEGNAGLVKALRESRVLILDDLGASTVSDWAQETMTDLVDRRLREGLRTIVTTNSTEVELEAAWGGRFMDRLRFRRTVVVFRGESRRKAAF